MYDVPLYPGSAEEARKRGELEQWRESFRANCACAGMVEIVIRENFDGVHLKDSAVEKVVSQFGYKRLEHVLANTVQELSYDGRFHPDNKEWANRHYVPKDVEHNACFVVRSHPAVLDGFIREYRKQEQALDLFDQQHCEPDSAQMDFTGKVLVLSKDTLKESCWSQQNQLWLALDGFGCTPTARGRSVRCICLGDGEQTRWNRSEFVGVLKDEFLPDWARENLRQYMQKQTETALVGRVSFVNGEAQEFTNAKDFLKCIQEELTNHPTTGFRYEVLTDDPAIRKAADDILYDLYGEENPHTLEAYETKPEPGVTMGGLS